MKNLILLLVGISLVALFASCVPAQAIDKSELEKSLFISLKGVKKDTIFEKTKQWIASNFVSAKAVMEYDNKEEGTIIGNTSLSTVCPSAGIYVVTDCNYIISMRVDIKDEKIRIKFFNVKYSAYFENRKSVGEVSDKTIEDYDIQTRKLVNSLTSYIKNTNNNSKW